MRIQFYKLLTGSEERIRDTAFFLSCKGTSRRLKSKDLFRYPQPPVPSPPPPRTECPQENTHAGTALYEVVSSHAPPMPSARRSMTTASRASAESARYRRGTHGRETSGRYIQTACHAPGGFQSGVSPANKIITIQYNVRFSSPWNPSCCAML